jgi:hypothetical protein
MPLAAEDIPKAGRTSLAALPTRVAVEAILEGGIPAAAAITGRLAGNLSKQSENRGKRGAC